MDERSENSEPEAQDDALREQVKAFLLCGTPLSTIARKTGAGMALIKEMRQALGLIRRHPARDQAEALLRQGLPIAKVASMTGATKTSVGLWRRELRLPSPRATPPVQAQGQGKDRGGAKAGAGKEASCPEAAAEMLRQGATNEAVFQAFGVRRETVARWRAELGLPHWEYLDPRRALGESLLRQGKTNEAVASAVDVAPVTVARWRRELGLPQARWRVHRRRRTDW
jgi:hypothetical protein